jgi:hypothetical protein
LFNIEDPVASGVNPVQEPDVPPVPCTIVRRMYVLRALVVVDDVPYNFTSEASEPDDVTAMHLVPVDPGLRPVAVNMAVFESSSLSATVPADQLLVGLAVAELKAE